MRIKSMDSIRGIAALVVLVHHTILAMPESTFDQLWDLLNRTPLRAVLDGRPAVIVFFVLSGFVLALPFLDGRGFAYGPYLAKRFCRLYLPFAAAVGLSAALFLAVDPKPVPEASAWLSEQSWTAAPTAEVLLNHLSMRGRLADVELDNVMWSLIHEMRISLVFPLLVLWARRGLAATLGAALATYGVAGLALAQLGLGGRPEHGETMIQSLAITLRFVPLFLLGIALAMNAARIREAVGAVPGWARGGLWVLAAFLLAYPSDLVNGAGAALVISLALGGGRAARVLEARAPQWLGRVSYSLYLVHQPVILTLVHLGHGLAPLWATLAVAAGVSLVAAEAMYRAAERPAMELGRRVLRGSGQGTLKELKGIGS